MHPAIDTWRFRGIDEGKRFSRCVLAAVDDARLDLEAAAERPGFLVHDSHLFDGVDERQVGLALTVGAEAAEAEGFQYIVTLNSDQLPDAFGLEKFVLSQRLTDIGEGGGLFGIRFEG